jgi:P-type E1-E2 ATPase
MEVKKQAQFSCNVKVHRYIGSEDEVETLIIDSSALVPGDIISIP